MDTHKLTYIYTHIYMNQEKVWPGLFNIDPISNFYKVFERKKEGKKIGVG